MGMRGTLITFEGAEGSGKSTQMDLACQLSKKNKLPPLHLREPGGVKISEKIRGILLDSKNEKMADTSEMLLYMAARAQLVSEVISPALKKGKIVLCDRFLDSTVVYQGYGNGMDLNAIDQVGRFATQGIQPDLTFLFDIDAKVGLSRIKREKDRIERKALAYHERVRKGYLKLAEEHPDRIRIIPAQQSREDIQRIVKKYLEEFFGKRINIRPKTIDLRLKQKRPYCRSGLNLTYNRGGLQVIPILSHPCHSRMTLAGIQTRDKWTPAKIMRG